MSDDQTTPPADDDAAATPPADDAAAASDEAKKPEEEASPSAEATEDKTQEEAASTEEAAPAEEPAAEEASEPAAEEAAPASDGDKNLSCGDCGKQFAFTAGEQEFYEEKGFTPPKRCPECRAAKKAAGRQFTKVTCAGCGKDTEVPFVPSGDRPVYCRDCFEGQKN